MEREDEEREKGMAGKGDEGKKGVREDGHPQFLRRVCGPVHSASLTADAVSVSSSSVIQ